METESLARRFIQVWSAGNLHLLDELAAPEIVVDYAHFPEPLEGVDAFRAVLEETFHHFPDLRIEVDALTPGPGAAAVEWRYTGTHRQGKLFGVEPAGARVEVPGFTLYRMRDGRVVEERGVVEVPELKRQLGAEVG